MLPDSLTLSNENTIGSSTYDGFVYTCYKSAKFDASHVTVGGGVKVISIVMTNTNDSVKITPALKHLTEATIVFLPQNESRTYLKVYASTDGINWGSPLTGAAITYGTGYVTAHLEEGDYYLKIVNTKGTEDVSITQMRYTFENCNCFKYESGE